jgi:hypothetical protein
MGTMNKSEVQNRKTEKFKQNILPWVLVLGAETIHDWARPLKIEETNPLHIILNLYPDQVMLIFELRAGLGGELQVLAHECSIEEITKALLCSAKRCILFHVRTPQLLSHCLTNDSPDAVWHKMLALL